MNNWMIWSLANRGYLGVGDKPTTPDVNKAGRLKCADAFDVVLRYPRDAVAIRAPEFCTGHRNALALLTHPESATVH